MTDLKYSILETLYNAKLFEESISKVISQLSFPPTDTRHAIESLIKLKLIRRSNDSINISLTDEGVIAFELAQEDRNKQLQQIAEQQKQIAEDKKQKQFMIYTTTISLAIALISTLIALANLVLQLLDLI